MFDQLREVKLALNATLAKRDLRSTKPHSLRKKKGIDEIDDALKLLLIPDSIEEQWDYVTIGGVPNSVIGCAGYPSKIRPKWLNGLIGGDNDVNFSQFITKIDSSMARVYAQKHLLDLETEELATLRDGNIPTEELKNKIIAIKQRIADLGSGREAAFDMGLYFSISGSTESVLREKVAGLIAKLNGLMIHPAALSFKKTNAYKNFMPSGIDYINMNREFDSSSMGESILLPRDAVAGGLTPGAIYIGMDFDTGIPIFYDKFNKQRTNYNCFTMGKSGSGKSFSISTRVIRDAWMGYSVSIVDPKNDYSHVIEKLGGVVVKICEGAEGVRMNPFDIGVGQKDTLTARQQEIPKFLLMLLGPDGVTAAGLPLIDMAVIAIYKALGITANKETWTRDPPILSDFYDYIEDYLTGKDIDREEKAAGKALLRKLKMYTTGSYANFFNGPTNIKMDEKYISYNLLEIPDTVQDAIMYQIMLKQFAFMINKASGKRTLIVDEAWSLMQKESQSIKSLVKLCRYFGLSVELSTQDLGDISKTDIGDSVLGNCETKYIFGVEHSERDKIKAAFGLTDEQADFITGTRKKGECLFISSGVVTKLKIIAAPLEKQLIESNATATSEPACIKTDLRRLLFPIKEISTEQRALLEDEEYRAVRSRLLGPGQATFMIKKTGAGNQSDEHFILTRLVADLAEKENLEVDITDYGKKTDVFITGNNGQTVGFEIEMGTNNNSDLLKKVTRLNDMKDLDNWYFVTSSDDVSKYTKHHNNTISFADVQDCITKFVSETK